MLYVVQLNFIPNAILFAYLNSNKYLLYDLASLFFVTFFYVWWGSEWEFAVD